MIDATAQISSTVKVGKNTMIWGLTQIRENTTIGTNCVIGSNVYIDHDIEIGSNVKIQNNALIYYKSKIEDNVFIGPAAALINDKYPRAVTKNGKLKTSKNWHAGTIIVKRGASIGCGAIILPDITIGKYSLIGAGSVVTLSTKDHSKLVGNPAKVIGYICKSAHDLKLKSKVGKSSKYFCPQCNESYLIKND